MSALFCPRGIKSGEPNRPILVQWLLENTNFTNRWPDPLAMNHLLLSLPHKLSTVIHKFLETYRTHLTLNPCVKTSNAESQLLSVPGVLFSRYPFLHCSQHCPHEKVSGRSKNPLPSSSRLQGSAGTSSVQGTILRP